MEDSGVQQIRATGLFPTALELVPPDVRTVTLKNEMQRSLSILSGFENGKGYIAEVTRSSALKVHAYGTNFRTYSTKAGTAPAAYDSTHLLQNDDSFQRFDILVETEQAIICFQIDDIGTMGDDIPLVVGAHSILFTSQKVQIAKRGATAGTYTIIGYR